ncbi:MAG: PilZ domain-containing protein [Geobacteraceae bacterium]|nr:PilZ domain-containing protein [Geobacteraceae bacterium]
MKRLNKNQKSRKSMLKRLLGMTVSELTSTIGTPYVSYSFRDEEVFVYEKAPVANIALHRGLVVKCDTMIETRKNPRVKPNGKIPVIAYGKSRIKGVVRDISVDGISVSHEKNKIFKRGERVILTFLLPTNGINRFLEIPCLAKDARLENGMRISVFLYNLSNDCSQMKIISRYVSIRTTQNELDLDDLLLWGGPANLDSRCVLTA